MPKSRIITFLSLILCSFVAVVGFNLAPSLQLTAIAADPVELTVSAAGSLTDVMGSIKPIYEQEKPDVTLVFNLGPSGRLQQQIEQGAPVDIFISAASKQMDALEEKNLLLEGSRQDLLKNQMVLIVPADNTTITSFQDLSQAEMIAIGEPESVPAGKYAVEVLNSQGVMGAIEGKIIYGKDVRHVLSYVETGNVSAGIVFLTDALISDQVKVVATAPEDSHSPVVYPIAVIKDTPHPEEAKELVEFLKTDQAVAVFEDYGFIMSSP